MNEKAIEAAKAAYFSAMTDNLDVAFSAAIAAYEAAMWRPIEAAPKDGTPILGFLPLYGFSPETGIEVIWFEPSIKCWLRRGEAVVDLPTHFRPLPQPPEVK